MALFRNYTKETVSHSVLGGKGQGQGIGRMLANEDIDVTSSEREFDINTDAQYDSDGEPDDVGRVQSDGAPENDVGVSTSQLEASDKRNVPGNWGSSFWKNSQPMGAQVASDSGEDLKSEGRNVQASEDNISDGKDDRLDSEEEEGQKEMDKVGKGHSDVPADEMLSDEYYEQDGEDQSDMMHYSGFSHSVGLSRMQSKPLPRKSNMSTRSRGCCNHDDDDDDNNDDGDADYEEEGEEDGNLVVVAVLF